MRSRSSWRRRQGALRRALRDHVERCIRHYAASADVPVSVIQGGGRLRGPASKHRAACARYLHTVCGLSHVDIARALRAPSRHAVRDWVASAAGAPTFAEAA